jgi:hypothetical protein
MPNWKKVITSGSSAVLNSLVAPSITGSLFGTASYATQALSSSNALTASFVNPLRQDVLITGSLIVSASGATNDFQVGANKLFVSASGNVGIGTTTPTQGTLQVNGNVFATSFTGSLFGTASFATTASYVSSNFQYEIHVSQVDGNDTTGDGSLLKPVATVTKALTLLGASRKTIIIHPGVYSENVTVANTNTTISTSELTGANTLLSGTLTIGTLGSGTRISGLKMSNLVISGTAQAYISNCTIDTQVTKSSSGFVEIINSEMQCTLGIQISGAGTTIINGNKNIAVSVSNASAQVIIKGCNSVVTPSASAGNLTIVDCIVTALGGNGITITGASTTLALLNSQVLVTAGTSVAPISVAGIYSIINTIYDKPSSTLTGTSANSIDYFQYINADNITITNGLTVTGSITVSGSVINNLTASYAISASQALSSSFATTASFVNPLRQDVLITGSLVVSASGATNDLRVGTNKLFVSASGDIGIGITTPTAKLHVNNTTIGNSLLIEDDTNPDATPFVIDTTGKVVIGGLSPYSGVAEFTLTGSAGVVTFGQGVGTVETIAAISTLSQSYSLVGSDNSTVTGGSSGIGLRTYGSSSTDTLFGYPVSSSVALLGFPGTNARQFMGTTSARTVILGASKELIRLRGEAAVPYIDITGSAIITGSLIVSASGATNDLQVGTNKLFVSASGAIGIGKTTPSATLDVNGNTIITGSLSITSGSQTIRFISGSNTSGYTVSVGINDDGVNIANNSTIRGFNFSNVNGRIMTMASILYNSAFSNYVGIGIPSSSSFDSTNPEQLLVSSSTINNIVGKTNINNYTQLNIVNTNSGTAASADVVATNNAGNESGNFIDMGINGSGYAGGIIGVANEAYLYNTGSQLWVGNATPGSSGNVNIFAGNLGTSTAIFVSSSQRVSINKITPNATFDVNGNTIITGSLSVTSVSNSSGSFVTIDANNTLNSRTAAQTRVDINYYGLTYAMQNGYY